MSTQCALHIYTECRIMLYCLQYMMHMTHYEQGSIKLYKVSTCMFLPACYSECTKLLPAVLMKKSIIWSRTLGTRVTGFENDTSVAPTSQASVSVMILLPIVNIHTKFHHNSPAVLETKYDYEQTHRISPVCTFLCISWKEFVIMWKCLVTILITIFSHVCNPAQCQLSSFSTK